MAEVVEQTTTRTTKWYSGMLTPQNVVFIIGIFVSATFFVFRMNQDDRDIKEKADEKELIQLKEQFKDLEDRVNRQYSTAKDDRDKENAAIEQVADWMHEQIGYQQAIKEQKK